MNKGVIYTAIFGGKDALQDPDFQPEGFDFVCFTDNPNITSEVWDVRRVKPISEDPVRCARQYKILPHKFLPEYEKSIWIDGNMVVTGNPDILFRKYLKEVSLGVFNHNKQVRRLWGLFWVRDKDLARDCVYDEAKDLLQKNSDGWYMDNPELIKSQVERYREEGYPEHNGLTVTRVLFRKHMEESLQEVMEAWWQELVKGSRRDQLSFNYVMWRHKFPFVYLPGDPRYNNLFRKIKHAVKDNYK